MIAPMPRDTRTRYQGVYARHTQSCAKEHGGPCTCKSSYYGVAYDRAARRTVKTRRQATVDAARAARADLIDRLGRGETPTATRGLRLTPAREQFIASARAGQALNKRGQRYKPSAIYDLEHSLRNDVEPTLGRRRLTDVKRGDVQAIIDRMVGHGRSGSRVRSVVNAIRSLYRWARLRDLAQHDPAADVLLPAMAPTETHRVVSPGEFARLLDALPTGDQLAYALAGYGMGRAAQIIRLRWRDVDLEVGTIEWGVEWEARKYDASRRIVPAVPPLLALLKRAFLEAGRPDGTARVCPPHYRAASGLMSTGGLAKRSRQRWQAAGLAPITLQECRHSAASWLDAAGVSPKVASVLMGHAVPVRQAGAAPVTLGTYTHALAADLERARDQLAAYLAGGEQRKAGRGT